MRELPLTRQYNRPIGFVTGPKTVRGEWSPEGRGGRAGGNQRSWERVPRGAILFTPSVSELWPMVKAGAAHAFRWKNHGIVSFNVFVDGRCIKVISLRGLLDHLARDDQYETLLEFVEWIRSHGANVGTVAGMNYSLWRTTLHRSLVSTGGPDRKKIMLGARIENHKNRGIFEDVKLWDLTAAYSSTIGKLAVPRRWVHRKTFDWDGDGYVKAEVTIPNCWGWGPLGVDHGLSPKARMLLHVPPPSLKFPVNTTIAGLWTAEEMRGAEAAGCDMVVTDWYEPVGGHAVFAEWWQIILEGRETLSKDAQRILKWGANALWGKFCSSGHQSKIWFDDKGKHREEVQYEVVPKSIPIAGLVAGNVRARLYREAIMPFAPAVLSCHTDGVFLPKGLEVSPNGGKPGSWRAKKECRRLYLIDAQTYKYESNGEEWYVMAGVKERNAANVFDHLWERKVKNA